MLYIPLVILLFLMGMAIGAISIKARYISLRDGLSNEASDDAPTSKLEKDSVSDSDAFIKLAGEGAKSDDMFVLAEKGAIPSAAPLTDYKVSFTELKDMVTSSAQVSQHIAKLVAEYQIEINAAASKIAKAENYASIMEYLELFDSNGERALRIVQPVGKSGSANVKVRGESSSILDNDNAREITEVVVEIKKLSEISNFLRERVDPAKNP